MEPDLPLTGLNVFIAEDEALVAMEMEHMVECCGGTVVGSARTCQEAEKICQAEPIDVAILDINLADCEVFDAAKVLQKRDIPFAFYSGRASREMVAKSFPDAGWLSKPSSQDEIIREVERLVSSSELSVTAPAFDR